jgi:hypothetical protein
MPVTNPYATVQHVQAHLSVLGGPGITIGETSKPTALQVELWLDQVAAEIDSLLRGKGYGIVPATGTSDILLVGRYVAQKVAAMTFMAGFMSDELPAKVKSWNDQYDLFTERLIKGTQQLVDQSYSAGTGTAQMEKYGV